MRLGDQLPKHLRPRQHRALSGTQIIQGGKEIRLHPHRERLLVSDIGDVGHSPR